LSAALSPATVTLLVTDMLTHAIFHPIPSLPSLHLQAKTWVAINGSLVRQPMRQTVELVETDVSQHFLITFDEQSPDEVDVIYLS